MHEQVHYRGNKNDKDLRTLRFLSRSISICDFCGKDRWYGRNPVHDYPESSKRGQQAKQDRQSMTNFSGDAIVRLDVGPGVGQCVIMVIESKKEKLVRTFF